jgi:glycosyltransferase involved in cell wall biosynthesis
LYSRAFWPATGGIETVSMTLATQIAAAGHDCTVVPETTDAGDPTRRLPFAVERAPGARRRLALARWADVVHSNGASLALFPYAKLARRPFMWTHAGYQVISVDGAGWSDGEPAPLTPLASLRFHARKRGLRVGAVQAVKLGVRQAVARMVDKNVAITNWVAARQPLPRQVVIYNPFPLNTFKRAASLGVEATHDFLYLGRLVSEKGVDVLLRALAEVNARPGRRAATLLVVGDGDWRPRLEQLASELGVAGHVQFAGRKVGDDLLATVARGAVAIVPSQLEEPMGGVALELLAAQKPLIVSERGGLAECVEGAAWTFPNGDHRALATCMSALLDDPALRASRQEAARRIVARFDESRLAGEYLNLYREILTSRGH